MLDTEQWARLIAARAQPPPRTSGIILYWDGMGPLTRANGPPPGAAPPHPTTAVALRWMPAAVQEVLALGRPPRPWMPAGTRDRSPAAPPEPIEWTQAAHSLTWCLDPGLLFNAARDVLPTVTGDLVWVHRPGDGEAMPCAVYPMLLVPSAPTLPPTERVEIVAHLPAADPLLAHSALVLQAAVMPADGADRLYAKALTNALANHVLRRFALCGALAGARPGGLTPAQERRTMAYIQAHLEHEVPLAALAAVAQLSPSHFARLFKHTTGQTPHQYVRRCRLESAKQLLTETALPLLEIGLQVGIANHSAFTALFRKHVGTTPKAYRDATQRCA
jgi:AraC-like DNA-binding protein